MKYLYGIVALLLIAGGLYISTQLELQPPSKVIVAYEQLESPEAVGALLAQKLKPVLEKESLLLIGVTPNQVENLEVVKSFLTETSQIGEGYKFVIAEPLLPHMEILNPEIKIDIKNDMPRFVEGVKEALKQGQRIAVIVPAIYASQLLATNPADRLKTEHQLNFLSLTISPYPVTAKQAETFDPPCVGEKGHDHTGAGKLGCAIQQISRRSLRYQAQSGKYSVMVEKFVTEDYLILFNRN